MEEGNIPSSMSTLNNLCMQIYLNQSPQETCWIRLRLYLSK